jgi:hypothetical protein
MLNRADGELVATGRMSRADYGPNFHASRANDTDD